MSESLDGSFRRIKHQKRAFRSSRKRNGFYAIGLGAMGLHSFLAQNKIRYGSKRKIRFDVFLVAEPIGRWLLQTKLRLRRNADV